MSSKLYDPLALRPFIIDNPPFSPHLSKISIGSLCLKICHLPQNLYQVHQFHALFMPRSSFTTCRIAGDANQMGSCYPYYRGRGSRHQFGIGCSQLSQSLVPLPLGLAPFSLSLILLSLSLFYCTSYHIELGLNRSIRNAVGVSVLVRTYLSYPAAGVLARVSGRCAA